MAPALASVRIAPGVAARVFFNFAAAYGRQATADVRRVAYVFATGVPLAIRLTYSQFRVLGPLGVS